MLIILLTFKVKIRIKKLVIIWSYLKVKIGDEKLVIIWLNFKVKFGDEKVVIAHNFTLASPVINALIDGKPEIFQVRNAMFYKWDIIILLLCIY